MYPTVPNMTIPISRPRGGDQVEDTVAEQCQRENRLCRPGLDECEASCDGKRGLDRLRIWTAFQE